MAAVKLGSVARECRQNWAGTVEGVPIVGLEHLIPEEITLSSWNSDTDNTFSKKFEKGQVLLGRRRVYLKKAAIAPFDGICSGDITVIEAIPGKIAPELLPFIIQNDKFFDYAMQGSAGSLSPRVKWEHLKDYEFELPDILEQRKLADKLWAAYRLKQSYKKMIEATDEMVKSRFIEMSSNWHKHGTIRDLVDDNITRASKRFAPCDIIQYIDISSVDSESNCVTSTTEYTLSNAPSRAQQCTERGDILVSTVRPNLKNIAINQIDGDNTVASTGFCVLRPKTGYQGLLLAYVLSEPFTKKMVAEAKGSNYPAIHDTDVLSYPITIPEESELDKIDIFIQQADKSKFELKQAIEKIDKVMRSLLQ